MRQTTLVSRLLLCCARDGSKRAPALKSLPPLARPAAALSAAEPPPFVDPARNAVPAPPPKSALVAAPAPTPAPVVRPAPVEPVAFEAPAIPAPFLVEHPAAARSAPPAMAPVMAPTGNGLRILLAEDNPINMMLIRELLRRRGHTVVEVNNGAKAVAAMRESAFDLLLTDIHMPGMDGVDAARAIRAEEIALGRPRTAIVALTADALEDGKRACREAGMDGFLTKPVDPAELEEMFLMLFPSEEGSHIVAA